MFLEFLACSGILIDYKDNEHQFYMCFRNKLLE